MRSILSYYFGLKLIKYLSAFDTLAASLKFTRTNKFLNGSTFNPLSKGEFNVLFNRILYYYSKIIYRYSNLRGIQLDISAKKSDFYYLFDFSSLIDFFRKVKNVIFSVL